MKSKYQKYQKNKLRNPKEMEKAHQEKLRKKAISELEPRYKIYRKKAIQEERMDFAGEEEVSIVGRDALFDILKKLFDLNARISDTDISLIKNAFYTHPEFIAKEKLKFIIDVAYKQGGISKLDETVNDLLSLLRDTVYCRSMVDFKKWVNMKKISSRIEQLISVGSTSEQIAEKLHLSTAEVKVFLGNQKEMPELFETKTR